MEDDAGCWPLTLFLDMFLRIAYSLQTEPFLKELEVSQDPGGKERVKKGYMSFW